MANYVELMTMLFSISPETNRESPAKKEKYQGLWLILVMLVILLVLDSLAFVMLAEENYLGALLRTLIVAVLALFILSWRGIHG